MRLRAELEEAQRLRIDVDELRQYCRQLEAESGRWKCRSCTFINQAKNPVCEMCSVPNSSRDVESADDGGGGFVVAGGSRDVRDHSQRSQALDHDIVGLPR